jgi:molybdenum cofactor guanylyltransferase
MTPTPPTPAVTGVILAGGRATRMGGADKGLITLAGRPMVAHVGERLAPQVGELLINANRNAAEYAPLACRVVGDTLAGFLGPLAGVLAAMNSAQHPLLATVPCDSPFVPGDLVSRLRAALEAAGADLAVAHDGERMQPVFLLARTALRGDLEQWLQNGGRKLDAWFARHAVVNVDFSDCPEAFLNINTPDERAAIEARLGDAGS